MEATEKKNDQLIRDIREVLEYDVVHRDLQANELMLLEAMKGQPTDIETICRTLDGIKGRLAESPAWSEAVSALRQAHPEFQISQALLGILSDALMHRDLKSHEVSGPGLVALAESIDAKQPFPRTERAMAEQAEIALRARLIEEVSEGKDFYSARDGGNSYIQKFRSDELPTLTTERLLEVHTTVTEQRRLEQSDSKQWLKDQRKEQQRRDLERLGIRTLPEQWKLEYDGDPSRTSNVRMNAGDFVKPTGDIIRRMNRLDILALTKKFGAAAVNQALGVKTQSR